MKGCCVYVFLLLSVSYAVFPMDDTLSVSYNFSDFPPEDEQGLTIHIIEPKTPEEIHELSDMPIVGLIINGYFHRMPYGSHTIINVIQADLMLMKLFRKLKRLEMSVLGWSTLPVTLDCLENLRSLSLSHNKLKILPDELHMLTKLEEFLIDQNRFRSMPAVIFC